MATTEELEKRIQILEDCEAIKKLKSNYAYCVDEKDLNGILDFFTEDLKFDLGPYGKCEGKKELEKYFKESYFPVWTFNIHFTQDPVIEINGDEAKGRWYVHSSSTTAEKNQAVWVAARYDDKFVKKNGKWKCKSLLLTIYYVTPFEKGWAKAKMLE